ncbi:helix-turn-helix domain-containing protein [Planctomycetota bacterium]
MKRSINNEINRRRIENIKLKLMNSHIPICRIAKSMGYNHTGHFSRYFKKITSMSPLEFRRFYGNPPE